MTKLVRYGLDWLVVNSNIGVYFLGTFQGALDALETCGVDANDIDVALTDFHMKGHNYADFGVNGNLTFTAREPYLDGYDKKIAA